jgi:regulator of nucleoside diphosphate kinase
MNDETNITVTEQDYEKLSLLLLHTNTELLEEELSRATIVPQKEISRDIVTMNSTVRFIDEETMRQSELTLVYPKDADVEKMKVSVLAPVGTALLGLRIGQSIQWPMPNGKKRTLKVLSIIFQPEATEHWEL